MAAWFEGRTLAEIAVAKVMSAEVVSVAPDDDVTVAATTMSEKQVRRLAVCDPVGRLVGVLSINDLAVSIANDADSPDFDQPRIDPETVAGVLRAVAAPRSR